MRTLLDRGIRVASAACTMVVGQVLAQTTPQPWVDSPPAALETFGADPGIGVSLLNQQNGEFNHKIPLKVPSFRGAEPRLALEYQAFGPNGFVGVGWTIRGISVIQRATPGKGAPSYSTSDVFLLDGHELVPCTAGSVSPSCASGGNYSTKIESYRRVYLDAASNTWTVTDKDGTTLTYTQLLGVGARVLTYTFRWGLSRKVDPNGNAIAYGWWCDTGTTSGDCYIDNITYGNVRVSFYREPRPDQVSFAYGGGLWGWLGFVNYRLKAIDVSVGGARTRTYALTYAAPSANTGRSLLASVQQYGKDAAVDAITYAVTAGTALPAETFEWASNATGIQASTLYTNASCAFGYCGSGLDGGMASGAWWITGDFDGDGKTDILIPSHGAVQVTGTFTVPATNAALLLSTGSSFQAVPLWSAGACYQGYCGMETDPWVTGDFNGDGKTDFIVHNANYGALFTSNGHGFDITWLWTATSCYQGYCTMTDTWTTGDFDGDGKTDFIVHNANYGALFTSNGHGFDVTWLWSGTSCYQGYCTMMDTWTKGDFNGDGKMDLIVHNPTWGALFTATANGRGFNITWLWQNNACYGGYCPATFGPSYVGPGLGDSAQSHWIVGDFNGDGKADFIIPGSNDGTLFTSTGSGFYIKTLYRNPGGAGACFGSFCDASGKALASGFRAGDFNGDGRTDLIVGPGDGGAVALLSAVAVAGGNDGTSFQVTSLDTSTLCGLPTGNTSSINDRLLVRWLSGDFNGDGKQDIVATGIHQYPLNRSGVWGTPSANLCTAVGSAGDLLTSISNGIGGTTAVAYSPDTAWPTTHADPSCTPVAAQPSCPNNPPIRQVVSAITVNDGQQGTATSSAPAASTGHSATTSYSYAGGYWDPLERRHLGYRYEKRTLPCDNGESACPYEEFWFHQDYGSVTKPEQIFRSTGAGILLRAMLYTYATNGATVPYQSLETGRWDYVYDGTGGRACPGASCKRKFTGYAYDNRDASGGWVAGYGNRTQVLEYGDYDAAGDERTTNIVYASPNTAAYIVAAPAVADVYAGIGTAGALLSETITYYDNATTWQAVPSKGNATAVARCQDTTLPAAQRTYVVRTAGYDAYGNLTSLADENGNPTTVAYDATLHRFPTTFTNALGQTWTAPFASWDQGCGVATQVVDPNAQTLGVTVDPLCRPTLFTRPLGGFIGMSYCGVTSTTNPCGATSGPTPQFTEIDAPSADGNGNQWLRLYFDGRGRIWRMSRKGPSAQQGSISIDTAFGARGRKSQQTAPYYPGDPAQWTRYLYDTLDRTLTVTHPDGASASRSYNLWSATMVDELGHPKTDTRDAFGNVVNRQETLGTLIINTAYAYDLSGNLKNVTDAAGNLWTNTFDSLGRNKSRSDPDSGTWTFEYHPNGTVKSQTDAKGQKTTMEYDPLGRISFRTMLDGTTSASTDTWTYDEPRTGYFNVGHLTTATDGAGRLVLDYDAGGRPVQATRTIGAASYAFSYGYDAGNRLLSTTFPDGDAIGTAAAPMQYDGAGRLFAVPGIVDSAYYDARDHRTQLNAHNGTTSTRTYSPARGWLTGITTASTSAVIQSLVYSRDAKGRVTQVTSPSCLEGWSYAYDDLDRLVSALNLADYTRNETYSYDVVGNITYNSRVGAYRYGIPGPNAVAPHAVLAAGPNGYQYDPNGSMTSGAGRTLSYDGLNRLASVNGVSFAYAADGSRVKKNGAVVTYYIGDDFEVSSTGVVTKYIRIGNERVAKRVGATTYWLHQERLGSTNVLTDATGAEVQRKKYTAYGDELQTTTGLAESTGFTGERQDETGLLYLHARYYDPLLARYVSADGSDPRRSGVGVNRYAYALGNPVGITDHSGQEGDDGDFPPEDVPPPDALPPMDAGDDATDTPAGTDAPQPPADDVTDTADSIQIGPNGLPMMSISMRIPAEAAPTVSDASGEAGEQGGSWEGPSSWGDPWSAGPMAAARAPDWVREALRGGAVTGGSEIIGRTVSASEWGWGRIASLGVQVGGAVLTAVALSVAPVSFPVILGAAVLTGLLSVGAYEAGSLLEGKKGTRAGDAVAFVGGALGPLGVGVVGLVGAAGSVPLTASQLAAFDVLWNAEISLTTVTAGLIFP